jgi:N-acetylglucosaminyldiphosphoundecaprenol N-acetyl-beta-D-mannosaminyltransferase
MEIFRILGAPCYEVKSIKEVKNFISYLLDSNIGGYSVAINAEKIMMFSRDPEMRTIIENSVLPIPDGSGALLGLSLINKRKSIKLDLPKTILELSDLNNYRVFILGASEDVNRTSVDIISKKFPGISIVGRMNGFFEDLNLINKILLKSNPQVVLVAMGSPKQEKIAVKLQEVLPNTLFIGCGGALNILSGKVKRAPLFFQNYHLEWFYRLVKEPSRFKRQLILPIFFCKLISHSIKLKK